MIKLTKVSKSTIHYVKLELKSDMDKIESAFDCYRNNAITDEIILDTSTIDECDEATATAINIFGEDAWSELPEGLVLFHA